MREQDARRDVGGRLQRHARLTLATALEPPLALAAGAMAPVDLPPPDLRVDQPLAGEHPGGVPAEPHEQHADDPLAPHVVQQRRHVEALARPLDPRRERRERRVGVEHPPSAPSNVTRSARTVVLTTPPWRSAQRPSQRSSRAGGMSYRSTTSPLRSSSRLRTLPAALRGSSSTNSNSCGTL